VYSTCLFCNKHLGTNEAIELFPVGRRIAFDSAKGRLWVVCRRCERWNLSPFEERWEALEDCERRFRDARKRVSTDNIGLARLDEGLDLVRIGEPLRPEFAAWRYGDQFGRRRRRAIVTGAGLAVVGGSVALGVAAAGAGVVGGMGIYRLIESAATGRWRSVARIPAEDGRSITVRGADLQWIRLFPGSEDEDFRLELWHPSTHETVLTGLDALHATALLMPRINRAGASARQVRNAIERIEVYDDPLSYLNKAAREAQQQTEHLAEWTPRHVQRKAGALQKLPAETRLAIEMATNEENERAALAGELALLELAWRDAEEIAGIADKLVLPRDVEARYERLKDGGIGKLGSQDGE
jgi:hypothetical protein